MEHPRRRDGVTTPTNWPNPERPGVPMFPERDGEHVFFSPFEGAFLVIFWEAATERYLRNGKEFSVDTIQDSAIGYHGPVLTPTQIAEMLEAERERCAKKAQEISDKYYDQREAADNDDDRVYADERMCSASECASDIRNLGAAS